MVDLVPDSTGIRSGKVSYGISVDHVIESEEESGDGTCKKRVCRFGKNVIA